MTPLKLKPRRPTGKSEGIAIGEAGTHVVFADTWPPSPLGDAFKAARTLCDLSLSEAAAALRLSVAEVCGIEVGAYEIDAADLGRAMVRLARVAR